MALRERLKRLIKPFHDELEGNGFGKRLFSKTLTKEEYARYLNSYFVVVSLLEKLFLKHKEEFLRLQLDITPRLKANILESMIIKLQAEPKREFDYQFESDFESAVGYMYVLEGSTMGGRIIAKELENQGFEFDYFYPYKDQTDKMWSEFIAFLERFELSRFDTKKSILAACELFLVMNELFRDGECS